VSFLIFWQLKTENANEMVKEPFKWSQTCRSLHIWHTKVPVIFSLGDWATCATPATGFWIVGTGWAWRVPKTKAIKAKWLEQQNGGACVTSENARNCATVTAVHQHLISPSSFKVTPFPIQSQGLCKWSKCGWVGRWGTLELKLFGFISLEEPWLNGIERTTFLLYH